VTRSVLSSPVLYVGANVIRDGAGTNGNEVGSQGRLIQACGNIERDVTRAPARNGLLLGLVCALFSSLLVSPFKFLKLAAVGAALRKER
jgi:hypothetical protein